MPGKKHLLWSLILTLSNVTLGFIISKQNVTQQQEFAGDTLEETHGRIIHVSVLFRHGNRTPTCLFPTLEYDESIWSEGIGQLNKIGKLVIYELGKWFRERYKNSDLVLQGYRNDLLLMNSSDVDRTLMSAELLLAGFLPPNSKEMWASNGLKWQPIPVHSKPTYIDEYLAGDAVCERYDMEVDAANESPQWVNYYRKNEKLFKYIAKNAGIEVSQDDIFTSLKEVAHIYDTLKILEYYNGTIPFWAKDIYPDPMSSLFPMYVFSRVSTAEMQRLQGGPFMGSVVSDMLQKRSGLTNQTFHFYSAHDTTIVAVLVTIGLYNFLTPDYGASLILELRAKNEEYFVTILYRNETDTPPYPLILPQCGEFCTLDKFVEVTKPLIPENWAEECQVGALETLFFYSNFITSVLLAAGCFVLIALAAIVVLLWVRKKRREDYNVL